MFNVGYTSKTTLAVLVLLTSVISCSSDSPAAPVSSAVILDDQHTKYTYAMRVNNIITDRNFYYIKDKFGNCYSVLRFTLPRSEGVSHASVPCDKVGL